MRGWVAAGLALLMVGCGDAGAPGDRAAVPQSDAAVRAARRAYDGAPPVVGHDDFGMTCTACHDAAGQSVEDVGFAPASPHESTAEAPAMARCRQCHVFQVDDGLFVESYFAGLPQDLRRGERFYPGAPPTIPHRVLMRENCTACHAGPGARADIVTSHPERARCRQCHVPVTTRSVFSSALDARDSTHPEGR